MTVLKSQMTVLKSHDSSEVMQQLFFFKFSVTGLKSYNSFLEIMCQFQSHVTSCEIMGQQRSNGGNEDEDSSVGRVLVG